MDFKSNVPIYLQVIGDIKNKIITGEIPLGSKLPSSRELALKYQINPNTAARIYSEMELMGISYTRRGIGTFVTEDTSVIDRLKSEQTDALMHDFLAAFKNIGYSCDEIIALIKEQY